MRNFLVRKEQLLEYVKNKRAEKEFYSIVEKLHINSKMLNENVSKKHANQSVINDLKRKNLISERAFNMLIKNKVINENYEIL